MFETLSDEKVSVTKHFTGPVLNDNKVHFLAPTSEYIFVKSCPLILLCHSQDDSEKVRGILVLAINVKD